MYLLPWFLSLRKVKGGAGGLNTDTIPPIPLFGFCFPGPLLQHSHWAGHLLRGQIRESLFYITLQIWPEPS